MKPKKSLKEIIQNKQYRALIILGLYFIFFATILLSIKPATNQLKPNPKPIEKQEALEKYKLMKQYRFHYQVNYLDEGLKLYELNGAFNNGIFEFDLNNVKYKLFGDNLFIVHEEKLEKIDDPIIEMIISYNPENIYQLIKVSELTSKTELYGSYSVEKTYYSNTTDEDEPVIVVVKTIEKEEFINKISINFEDIDTNPATFKKIQSLVVSYEKE